MARSFLIFLLFCISLAATFFACIPQLALMKEGMTVNDLKTVLPCLFVFIAVIVAWIWLWRRYPSLLVQILGAICIVQAALPLILTLWVAGILLWRNSLGNKQSRNATISRYQDDLIQWPGFIHPVGLRVEIELPTPFAQEGNYAGFYSPVIWMGPALDDHTRRTTFFTFPRTIQPNDKAPELITVQNVLFTQQPKSFVYTTQDSKLIFNLYPAAIIYLEHPNAFCTDPNLTMKPAKHQAAVGTQLSAMWFYVGPTYVDLSKALTKALKMSAFADRADIWTNMHNQFNDENLFKMGYKTCELNRRKHCFCK